MCAASVAARALKRAHSLYEENRDLVLMGAYARGSDAAVDDAIVRQPQVVQFITQAETEAVDLTTSVAQLAAVFGQ